MRIAFCCDLHFTAKNEIRIIEGLNFLEYIFDYCIKNNIPNLVLGGDVFHTSNSIKNQAFIPVFMKLYEMSKKLHIYVIPGNHDIMNNDNDCLAETFSAFSTFIKKSATIDIDGVPCDFLAYTEDTSDIPNNGRILFSHLEVEGFYFNSKKKVENSIFTESLFENYELVVSGHLHKMQERNNFLFVGSPYETDRGEMGKPNYFAVISGEPNREITYELVSYEEAPKYMTIDVEQFNEDLDFSNKMITIRINKKIENFVKLRDIMFNKGCISVEPEFIKEDTPVDVGIHNISSTESVSVGMAKYLKEVKSEGIDNNKLLCYYKKVLKSM